MTETVLRAKGPADLLALVPLLLGFHPEDSVVLMTVGDAATPFHARIDLPRDPEAVAVVVAQLADVAGRHRTARAAVVLYTSDARLADAVADPLDRRLQREGVDVVCLVRADGERWWPVGALPEADGPGTRYDVGSHPWTAQAVVDGSVVLGSRRALAESLVGHDDEETARIVDLADEVAGRVVAGFGPTGDPAAGRRALVAEGRWVRERVRRFVADGRRLDTGDVARLATLTTISVEVRDVAWAELDRADAQRHVDLWRDVTRRVPPEVRAPAATLLGFASWLSGNGALAWCAVDLATAADPGYSLTGLLTQVLASAVPPSTWRPLEREDLTLFRA